MESTPKYNKFKGMFEKNSNLPLKIQLLIIGVYYFKLYLVLEKFEGKYKRKKKVKKY